MLVEPKAENRKRLEELVAKAQGGAENPAPPPHHTRKTWICLSIAAILIGSGGTLLAFSEKYESTSPLVDVASWSLLIGFVCLVIPLFDAFKPSAASRPNPGKLLDAYFRCVRAGYWEWAASCLSWAAKDGTSIEHEEIASLNLDAVAVQVRAASDLRTFWGPMIGGGRRFSSALRRYERLGDDRALIHGELIITFNLPQLGAHRARAGGNTIRGSNIVKIAGTWAAYSRDGKWYFLEAGFPPGTQFIRTQ
jgi:hypothetical protein